ncbi:hypothetical protein FRC04_007766 [Tulasnella sp. 424]|nr:hypothetical protein FRC04_007766 [Tulasnella sp. 424]
MSEELSIAIGPFDPEKITPPELGPDVYGLHGKNLTEEHLATKVSGPGGTIIPPTMPPNFAQSRADDKSVPGTVGILGAGVGGLYAAMMLHSLGIPFEILEASNRTGGRVFTFPFSEKKHDYYLNSDGRHVASKLIEYKFSSDESFRYFNQRRIRAKDVEQEDQFGFAATGVPRQDLTYGYEAILDDTFGPFVEALRNDLKPPGSRRGWQRMMRQDNHSARSYMAVACNLPMPTIHWCETMDASTDSYDKAFSEACLDMVAFGTKETKWQCLDGGSQVLTDAMTNFIEQHSRGSLKRNTRVTGLRTIRNVRDHVVGINVQTGESTRAFRHVISTIPLPVFRTLDLNDKRLFNIQQTNALRELSYSEAVKIGIKFKSQWWAAEGLDIVGGQSYSDTNIRTTVYPSYGLQDPDKTTVLIASYAWTSDAGALAALVSPTDAARRRLREIIDSGGEPPEWLKDLAKSEEEVRERLKDLVLRDLSLVHNVDMNMLKAEFDEMFPWAWQNDPLTQGAYAFFGPGQFGRLYRSLARPVGGYHLHMAGEALSVRHAWIVGALDASWRAVYEIVLHSQDKELYKKFLRLWGKNEEWIPSPHFFRHIGMEGRKWGENAEIDLDLMMLNILAHDSEDD